MNVTSNVIHDLLPLYAAGEATADTAALVEEWVRRDPALARSLEAMRSPLPRGLPAGLPPTREKEMLNRTRELLRWRGILMGLAVFLSLLPLSIRFDGRHISWVFLHDAPPQITALVVVAALAAWAAFLAVRRKLQTTGV
jgi:hypothetical protein